MSDLKDLSKALYVEVENLRKKLGEIPVQLPTAVAKSLVELEMLCGDIKLEISKPKENVA